MEIHIYNWVFDGIRFMVMHSILFVLIRIEFKPEIYTIKNI